MVRDACVRVCVCFLPIYSGRQVRWMYQPGSHRRKVTQDFSSTFLLRCMREGFSRSFPSSTVKSNLVYYRFNRSPLVGHLHFYFLFFGEEKSQLPGGELTSQRVRRLLPGRLPTELPGRPATRTKIHLHSTLFLFLFIDFSHKLTLKIQPVGGINARPRME